LSYRQVASSVVLIIKPISEIIDRKYGDVFLPITTRQSIETKLLHQRLFNLFYPNIEHKFNTSGENGFASHYLNLHTKVDIEDELDLSSSTVIRHVNNLNHSPFNFIPFYEMFGKPRWQTINKNESFEERWSALINFNELRNICNHFIENWIFEYGRKATRDLNKTLKLNFDVNEFEIEFEFDNGIGFDNKRLILLNSIRSSGKTSLIVNSVDFLFTLRQIADLGVTSNIDIKADGYVIVFKFSTGVNDYELWIPASDSSGKRLTKHFTSYKPEQSSDPIELLEPDDLVPEPSEDQMKIIEENIKRIKSRVNHK
jgi:hypothetical protein